MRSANSSTTSISRPASALVASPSLRSGWMTVGKLVLSWHNPGLRRAPAGDTPEPLVSAGSGSVTGLRRQVLGPHHRPPAAEDMGSATAAAPSVLSRITAEA